MRPQRTAAPFLFCAGFAAAAALAIIAGAAGAPRRPGDGSRDPPVVGEAEIRKGKVKLDLPPLVENGNTVPMLTVGRQPDDEDRSRQGDPRLQREEPAAERDQRAARARAPARPWCRRASGSPTRRP
jgi:hypothetical protein